MSWLHEYGCRYTLGVWNRRKVAQLTVQRPRFLFPFGWGHLCFKTMWGNDETLIIGDVILTVKTSHDARRCGDKVTIENTKRGISYVRNRAFIRFTWYIFVTASLSSDDSTVIAHSPHLNTLNIWTMLPTRVYQPFSLVNSCATMKLSFDEGNRKIGG